MVQQLPGLLRVYICCGAIFFFFIVQHALAVLPLSSGGGAARHLCTLAWRCFDAGCHICCESSWQRASPTEQRVGGVSIYPRPSFFVGFAMAADSGTYYFS